MNVPPIINKVPLAKKAPILSTFKFPEMPKLYLELLENKDKIQQQLVNKEYIPTIPTLPISNKPPISTHLDTLINDVNEYKKMNTGVDSTTSDSPYEDTIYSSSPMSSISISPNWVKERGGDKREGGHEERDKSEDKERDKHTDREEYREEYREYKGDEYSKPEDKRGYRNFDISRKLEDMSDKPGIYKSHMPSTDDILNTFKSSYSPQKTELPSLQELNFTEKTIPNLKYMPSNAEDEDLKRELLFKFELLKRSYKDESIPEFTIHSDYKSMKQAYDTALRKLSIDSTVDNYKKYLIGGFMVVEYALGKWMGFDMHGFTQQQIISISTYERLLVELGEKSYVDEESQWPVEARLLGLVIMNAAFFVVTKLITKKTGTNIMNMINSMNMHNEAPQKKRQMKGPNIDINNLPNL